MENVTPTQGPGQSFTAAQIAAGLGVSARAVRLRLEGIPSTGAVRVQGGQSKTWPLEALPEGMRRELDGAARQRG